MSQHISLPDTTYPYFEDWNKHPFRADATDFSWVNAWRLAEASLFAYCGKEFPLNDSKLRELPLSFEFFSGSSAQCHIIHANSFVIVAFRGTEFPQLDLLNPFRLTRQIESMVADVVKDLKIQAVPFEGKGKVHQGFLEAYNEISDELDDFLKRNLGAKTLWFTGHSMGGAMANIASVHYEQTSGLYTVGSPMVGDSDFAQKVGSRHFRFVYDNDFVANLEAQNHLPVFSHNYVHNGQEIRLSGGHHHALESVLAAIPLLGNLLDHMPGNYAETIQGNYKKSLLIT